MGAGPERLSLGGVDGFRARDDHAAYIASWLKVLKDDKRAIFTVASHAQKAADFLHGLQPNADDAPAEDLQEAA